MTKDQKLDFFISCYDKAELIAKFMVSQVNESASLDCFDIGRYEVSIEVSYHDGGEFNFILLEYPTNFIFEENWEETIMLLVENKLKDEKKKES